MPYMTERRHKAILNVVASGHADYLTPRAFLATYIPENSYGDRFVYPGLVVALSGHYYVPYNSSASYGTGSDTAVGILTTPVDATMDQEPVISPMYHGQVVEDHCYVLGSSLGSIPAAVKTDLNMIEWV